MRLSRTCRQASQTRSVPPRGANLAGLEFACLRQPASGADSEHQGRLRWQKSNGKHTGKIVEIKGVVLDAVFPDRLPEINHALSVQVPEDGGTRELIAEVQQHLGDDRVRAVAMDSTDGLARGVDIVDTEQSISVPVGAQTLGRIWNVIGDPIDGKEPATGERWPIHRDPPLFGDLSPTIEIFETGIKVVDLIAPFVRGGKVGLFGGAGIGKTVTIIELITTCPAARRRLGLLRRWGAHPRGQRAVPPDAGGRGAGQFGMSSGR